MNQQTTPKLIGLSLFELLTQDHDRVMLLFSRLENEDKHDINVALKLFTQIEEELKVHLEGEERFFYTALESHEEVTEKILQSYEEHLIIKTIMGAFNSLALDDQRWRAKLKVLKELVEIHIKQEEELLAAARALLDKDQVREITEQFCELKKRGSTMRSLGEPTADW